MVASTKILSDSPAVGSAGLPKRSTWELVQLAFFWVALNFHWAAVPIIILPQQIQTILYANHPAGLTGDALSRYVATNAPGALALVAGPGLLVALISNPLFGYLSDRTSWRWGRRRPYILVASLVNVGGLIFMALAPNIPLLLISLLVVQLANNAAAAPFHALLPDLVPESQRGLASGYMGFGQMAGTILGATVPSFLFNLDAKGVLSGTRSASDYHATLLGVYGFTAVFILVMAVLTVVTVRERPMAQRTDMPIAGAMGSTLQLTRDLVLTVVGIAVVTGVAIFLINIAHGDTNNQTTQNLLIFPALLVGSLGIAKAFDFRPRQQSDFAWVLMTRLLVMLGIYTVEVFLELYLQNVTFRGLVNPPDPAKAASLFIDILIVTAAVSTAFAGALSDRLGRKRMVYISGAFMALVGLIFLVSPTFFPGAGVLVTYICAAIFGLGYGAYVSVDWALVTDVLPDEKNFARDMGIWNIALTVPQVIAYIVGALVIAAFNVGGFFAVAGQPALGYSLLFVIFVLYAVAGTITVRFVRGVTR